VISWSIGGFLRADMGNIQNSHTDVHGELATRQPRRELLHTRRFLSDNYTIIAPTQTVGEALWCEHESDILAS
jgi:hypothetical protein